jgi:hypothetical protein
MRLASCFLPFVALSLAALAGCSSSSGNPTGPGGSGTGSSSGSSHGGSSSGSGSGGGDIAANTTAFCTDVLEAEATLLSKCLGGSAKTWAADLGQLEPCTELGAAATAGRVTFTGGSNATTCLSDFQSLSCTGGAAPTTPAACYEALSGAVKSGGTCYSDYDCSTADFCKGLGSGSCTGTCTALVAAGAACAAGESCVAGYECTGTCTKAAAATAGAALGAECGYMASTMTITACAGGLACNGAAQPPVCVAQVAEGAACTPGAGVCETFTYCDPTSKTCKSYPQAGGGCGSVAGQDPIGCYPGSYCKLTTGERGTCTALGATGATCKAAGDCASNMCSAGDGGTGACLAACTQE